MSGQEVAAAGVIAGGVTAYMIVAIVLWIVMIVARWKVFGKAGEAGWKSIIPIYSDYVQWRISWKKTGMFWLTLVLAIVASLLVYFSGMYAAAATGSAVVAAAANPVMLFAAVACLVVALVLVLMSLYKLMVAFGHGAGWFILSILFPRIMLLVLGFGSSTYSGPQD